MQWIWGTAEVSGSLAAANIADDSLDFTKFKDAMSLDVSTDIAVGSGLILSTSGVGSVSFNHTGGTTFAGNVDFGGYVCTQGAVANSNIQCTAHIIFQRIATYGNICIAGYVIVERISSDSNIV